MGVTDDWINLNVYLVGSDEESARGTFPFSDAAAAREYALDEYGREAVEQGEVHLWVALARLDFGTMAREEW